MTFMPRACRMKGQLWRANVAHAQSVNHACTCAQVHYRDAWFASPSLILGADVAFLVPPSVSYGQLTATPSTILSIIVNTTERRGIIIWYILYVDQVGRLSISLSPATPWGPFRVWWVAIPSRHLILGRIQADAGQHWPIICPRLNVGSSRPSRIALSHGPDMAQEVQSIVSLLAPCLHGTQNPPYQSWSQPRKYLATGWLRVGVGQH